MPTAGLRSLLAPWLGGVGYFSPVLVGPPPMPGFLAPQRAPAVSARARPTGFMTPERAPVFTVDPAGTRQ
jgi:hypothetical protein